MRKLKIAVAQFEPKDGDKDYNLSVIEGLTSKAKELGAEVISFRVDTVIKMPENRIFIKILSGQITALKPNRYG